MHFRGLRSTAWLLLIGASWSCSRDLSGPGSEVSLEFSISQISDSAAVGSIAIRSVSFEITATDDREYEWLLTTSESGWLSIADTTGRTPSLVEVRFAPSGLELGVYEDTILVTLMLDGSRPVSIPVRFDVHPCTEYPLTLAALVTGALSEADCGVPEREGRFADRYVFSGDQGDTVSIVMIAPLFDALVALDSTSRDGSSGLVTSDSCPGLLTNACIRNYELPYTGAYIVEATSGANNQTGGYVIEVSEPRSPDPPAQLQQLQSDGATAMEVGSAAHTSEIKLTAIVSDPDLYDNLRLQAEVRLVGDGFTGVPTVESSPVAGDETALVLVGGLSQGDAYHWRARVVDLNGLTSEWESFGNNSEDVVDFFGPGVGATHLEFATQPPSVSSGAVMVPPVAVTVRDAAGAIVTDYALPLIVGIVPGTGATGAVLTGTLSRVPTGGLVTFDDLSIDLSGAAYRLSVTSADLPPVLSQPFAVTGSDPSFVLFAQGFSSPLLVTAPPADVERMFVVEQGGRVLIVRGGMTLSTPFLDLSGEITSGGERGLLGLAFDPGYASNGFFFVNHTGSDGDTRLVRYHVSANPDIADPDAADTLLVVGQPFSNHNGGHLSFGPDGMLYMGLGDGGSGGDPLGSGQDLTTLLGNILRLDVSGSTGYQVPPDNPFVNDAAARSEIWISGVRNPWRFSFDRTTGDLYVGDVGQGSWEEVTFLPGGGAGGENLGWNVMEGAHCFVPSPGCNQVGLTLPVAEYSHSDGCSITGGLVYRGPLLPSIVGHYFYSDYCSGWIRSFRVVNGQATDQAQWSVPFSGNVTSFGEDADGSIYVVLQDGRIYRVQ